MISINRLNRLNRKKSQNRLNRFIGQRINTYTVHPTSIGGHVHTGPAGHPQIHSWCTSHFIHTLIISRFRLYLEKFLLESSKGFKLRCRDRQRVSPPDPKPEGRVSRLFFDFLGRELTLFGISLQGEFREWEKETPCGKGLGSWDTWATVRLSWYHTAALGRENALQDPSPTALAPLFSGRCRASSPDPRVGSPH